MVWFIERGLETEREGVLSLRSAFFSVIAEFVFAEVMDPDACGT